MEIWHSVRMVGMKLTEGKMDRWIGVGEKSLEIFGSGLRFNGQSQRTPVFTIAMFNKIISQNEKE